MELINTGKINKTKKLSKESLHISYLSYPYNNSSVQSRTEQTVHRKYQYIKHETCFLLPKITGGDILFLVPSSRIVVGCSLTFLCTPKDVKVHADDNGTIILLTNPTSFIGII